MAEERIAEVKYAEEYQMSVVLNDGQEIRCNMKAKLVTARFRDLEDETIFRSGKIMRSGRIIKWNDNTEMAIEEIMLQAEQDVIGQ